MCKNLGHVRPKTKKQQKHTKQQYYIGQLNIFLGVDRDHETHVNNSHRLIRLNITWYENM